MEKLDHMVQIAVSVILNKQYHLCEKQLCKCSLVHFFADTATITPWNYLLSRFLENAKERRRGFLSFVYLECGF